MKKRREWPDVRPEAAAAEDGFVTEDVHVLRTWQGRAVMLPTSLRRLSDDALDGAAQVQDIALRMEALGDELEAAIAQLREAGGSWAVVGWCVGTTGEAARQRWGNLAK